MYMNTLKEYLQQQIETDRQLIQEATKETHEHYGTCVGSNGAK